MQIFSVVSTLFHTAVVGSMDPTPAPARPLLVATDISGATDAENSVLYEAIKLAEAITDVPKKEAFIAALQEMIKLVGPAQGRVNEQGTDVLWEKANNNNDLYTSWINELFGKNNPNSIYKQAENEMMASAQCQVIDRPTLVIFDQAGQIVGGILPKAKEIISRDPALLNSDKGKAFIAALDKMISLVGPEQKKINDRGTDILWERANSNEPLYKAWLNELFGTNNPDSIYKKAERIMMAKKLLPKPVINPPAAGTLPSIYKPGETYELMLTGENLSTQNHVYFLNNGVDVTKKITADITYSEEGKKMTLKLTVAADAPVGPYTIQIRNACDTDTIAANYANAFTVSSGLSTAEVLHRLRVQDSSLQVSYPVPIIRNRQPDDAATPAEYGTFVDPNGYRGEFSIAPTIIGNSEIDDLYSNDSIHNQFFGPQLDNAFISNRYIGVTPSAFGTFNGPWDGPENGGTDYNVGGGLNLRGMPGWRYLMPDLHYGLTYASQGDYQTLATASEAFPRSTSLGQEMGLTLTSEWRNLSIPIAFSLGTSYQIKTIKYGEETFGQSVTGEDTALSFDGRFSLLLSKKNKALPNLGVEVGLTPWMPMSRHQTIDYLSVSGDTQVDTVSEDQVYNRHVGLEAYWPELSFDPYVAVNYNHSFTEGEIGIDTLTAYFGADFKRFFSLDAQYSWSTGISPYIEGGQKRFELILTGPTGRSNGWPSALYAGVGYEQNQDSAKLYYPNVLFMFGIKPFRFFGVPANHR